MRPCPAAVPGAVIAVLSPRFGNGRKGGSDFKQGDRPVPIGIKAKDGTDHLLLFRRQGAGNLCLCMGAQFGRGHRAIAIQIGTIMLAHQAGAGVGGKAAGTGRSFGAGKAAIIIEIGFEEGAQGAGAEIGAVQRDGVVDIGLCDRTATAVAIDHIRRHIGETIRAGKNAIGHFGCQFRGQFRGQSGCLCGGKCGKDRHRGILCGKGRGEQQQPENDTHRKIRSIRSRPNLGAAALRTGKDRLVATGLRAEYGSKMSLSAGQGPLRQRMLAKAIGDVFMYRLYGVEDFANLVVHMALEELGVPYEAVFLDEPAGALKTPAHLARHPLGLVPALETPDGVIFETGAILLWLADRHGGLAPAAADPQRGAFLSWYVFTNNSLHTLSMDLIHPYRVAGDALARAVAEGAHSRLNERLMVMEAQAARRPDWLRPEAPGVLGLYLSMLLRWVKAFAYAPDLAISAQDYPALHAIAAACETRPAVMRAAAANGLSGRFFTAPEV